LSEIIKRFFWQANYDHLGLGFGLGLGLGLGLGYGLGLGLGLGQTCAESQIFHEKSSQVTQKSSHDFDFFEKNKKVKVMTLTFLKNPKKSKS
jgi:hypothetical protein